MKSARIKNYLWLGISLSTALLSANAAAQNARSIDVSKARVVDHWTSERRAAAIPRDLVIDPRGLGYLRRPDGSLVPYGHDTAAQAPSRNLAISPFGQFAAGSGDNTGPTYGVMDPDGKEIGASYTFKATVTDPSGVRSVTFKIQKEFSTVVNSFSATKSSDPNVWIVSLQNFTNGKWKWWVEAKDGAGKGGNSSRSPDFNFTVSTGGSGSTGDTVTNAQWTAGGAVQTAAGRLYFEMPKNAQRTGPWQGYVCSGTVAADGSNANGRSVIITAAHCVYDDANKAFARNVMFIPDQAHTDPGSKTDRDCNNDPLGCWIPSFGVVDKEWTTGTFPANIKWDYAFYVVSDTGAHSTDSTGIPLPTTDALDSLAGSLPISFGTVFVSDTTSGIGSPDFTYALGYSYNVDPQFRYCAEDMTTEGTVNWWLPSCGLSGGSSGGPWVQPPVTILPTTWTGSTGSIISVNSWGYTNSPGMAGPKLVSPSNGGTSSASCVFGAAKLESFPSTTPPDGNAGKVVTCQ